MILDIVSESLTADEVCDALELCEVGYLFITKLKSTEPLRSPWPLRYGPRGRYATVPVAATLRSPWPLRCGSRGRFATVPVAATLRSPWPLRYGPCGLYATIPVAATVKFMVS